MEQGEKLHSHLLWLWENEKLVDVQLFCNNLPVASAHKVVLSAFSEYFTTLFCRTDSLSSSEAVEYVSLDNCEAANVVSIVRYLYTGKMGCLDTWSRERLSGLLNDTEKLGVTGAAVFIKDYMQKKEFLSELEEDALACVNITNSFDMSGIDLNKSFEIENGSLPQVLQDRSLETELSISIKYPLPKSDSTKDGNTSKESLEKQFPCTLCDTGTQTEHDLLKHLINDGNFSIGESITDIVNNGSSDCDTEPQRGTCSPYGVDDLEMSSGEMVSKAQLNMEKQCINLEINCENEKVTADIITNRDTEKETNIMSTVEIDRKVTTAAQDHMGVETQISDEQDIVQARVKRGRKSTYRKQKTGKRTRKRNARIHLENVKTEQRDTVTLNGLGLSADEVVLKQEEALQAKVKVKLEDGIAISSTVLSLGDLQQKREKEADGETKGASDNRGPIECDITLNSGLKRISRSTRAKPKKKFLSKDFIAGCKQDNVYMCPVCSELHSSVEGFRKHYKLSHSPGQQFICSHCDKCFMDNFKLQEHVRVHTGERPFTCPDCGSGFKAKKHLTKHMKVHNRLDRVPCTEDGCALTFSDRDQMSRHVRSKHLKLKPYKCTHMNCNYSAADSSGLKYHMQKHLPVTERQVNLCSICGAAVPGGSTNLKVHMVKHSDDYYSCHLCDYKTKYQMYLQSHVTRKHGVDSKGEAVEKNFKCPHCEFSCYFKHEFNFHLKKHNPEKPFKCKLCEYSTLTQSQLNAHIRTHTGAKPYTCKQCHKSFTQSTHLVRHTRTHTGEKPHKCEVCGEGFIEKRYLERHRYSAHLGYKPFMCHLCTYSCIKKDTLKNHIRSVHGEDSLPEDMKRANKSKILVSELSAEQQELLRKEGDQWQAQLPVASTDNILPPAKPYPQVKNKTRKPPIAAQTKLRPRNNTTVNRKDRRRKQNSPVMWKEAKLPPAYTTVTDVPLDLNTSNNDNTTSTRTDDTDAIMKQLQFHQQLVKFNSSNIIGGAGGTAGSAVNVSGSNPGLQQPQRLVTPPPTFIGVGGVTGVAEEDLPINMVTNQPVQVRIQSGESGSHHTISLQLPEYLTIPLHKAAASSLTELQAASHTMGSNGQQSGLSGLEASLWSQGIYHSQS